MRSPEGYEKDKITKFLNEIGAWHFKPTTMGYGGSGVPDIVGCYRGRFFAIEVKREGKEPTALQWSRMREINKRDGASFWGTADKVVLEMKMWCEMISAPLNQLSATTSSEYAAPAPSGRRARSGR